MNANAIISEQRQLQAKIDSLIALREAINANQTFFPTGTPKNIEYIIQGKRRYMGSAIRPIVDRIVSLHKREIEVLEQKPSILNAALQFKPLTRIKLTEDEVIQRCGKLEPIKYPFRMLS